LTSASTSEASIASYLTGDAGNEDLVTS